MLSVLCIQKKGDRLFFEFILSRPGLLLLMAIVIVCMSSFIIAIQYAKRGSQEGRQFIFTVILNIVPVTILLGISEVGLRWLSHKEMGREKVFETVLLPHDWHSVAESNKEIIKDIQRKNPFIAYDNLLGWTIASNAKSENGLYYSSTQGIRSPSRDDPIEKNGRPIIALVGDSYTFGYDVRFDQSWGALLDEQFSQDFQVLNFAVPGYGLGQSFLRYKRDVRPWSPKIVVFGFIGHDLYRAMTVYNFINFPNWKYPYAKPRFSIEEGRLRLINTPLLRPGENFLNSNIFELPFIDYDVGFSQDDWVWKSYHLSYILRFLFSTFPSTHDRPQKATMEQQTAIAQGIIKSFVASTEKDGAVPVIAYFPSRTDFNKSARSQSLSRRRKEIFKQFNPYFVDMTGCLEQVGSSERFVSHGKHYSAKGNRAVSRCMHQMILEIQSQETGGL